MAVVSLATRKEDHDRVIVLYALSGGRKMAGHSTRAAPRPTHKPSHSDHRLEALTVEIGWCCRIKTLENMWAYTR